MEVHSFIQETVTFFVFFLVCFLSLLLSLPPRSHLVPLAAAHQYRREIVYSSFLSHLSGEIYSIRRNGNDRHGVERQWTKNAEISASKVTILHLVSHRDGEEILEILERRTRVSPVPREECRKFGPAGRLKPNERERQRAQADVAGRQRTRLIVEDISETSVTAPLRER